MKIEIFGKNFYFLATEAQWEKLKGFLHYYLLDRPAAMFALLLCVLIFIVFIRSIFAAEPKKSNLNKIQLYAYSLVLLLLFIFNRESGERRIQWPSISDFITKYGFHESMVLVVLLDLIMFVPLGFFLRRVITNSGRRWGLLLCTAVLIEVLQYILARGYFAPVDIVAYIIGALCGSLIAGLIAGFGKGKKADLDS